MCGLIVSPCTTLRSRIGHRGPDANVYARHGKYGIQFHRLRINGTNSKDVQPFSNDKYTLVANAEIYNYMDLGGTKGRSDCSVILPTIDKRGLWDACKTFDGDFAFVYTNGDDIWAARDRVGVRPLFYSRGDQGISFASEAKALLELNEPINIFPPGHLYDSRTDSFHSWTRDYWDYPSLLTAKPQKLIYQYLHRAVSKRVQNTERDVGFFLSGGLDSSIVAALGKVILDEKIKTFSIGLEGSPDLVAARIMAKHLDSDHTEVVFSAETGLSVIEEVIWHLETFDKTTVRASIPMFLLSKHIREHTDIKVILSGEGSDELFGGYLYMHDAPTKDEFSMECNRLVNDVHMFDVLRADRTTAAHGLELRVPFFDKDLIEYVMNHMDTQTRMPKDGYEKWILRSAFEHMLPKEICWRQKNGMSDAVGYEWIEELVAQGENYRYVFNEMFGYGHESLCPYQWMPRWTNASDPSARNLKHFKK